MSKELEALEYGYKELFKAWLRLVEGTIKPTLPLDKKDIIEEKKDFTRKYNLIEKALKDFEWLKSIIPIDAMYMWNLSSDDKLKLLEIMGVKL